MTALAILTLSIAPITILILVRRLNRQIDDALVMVRAWQRDEAAERMFAAHR